MNKKTIFTLLLIFLLLTLLAYLAVDSNVGGFFRTATPTSSNTPTATDTSTPTFTLTMTPTSTETLTPTATPTPTFIPAATNTLAPLWTATKKTNGNNGGTCPGGLPPNPIDGSCPPVLPGSTSGP